MIVEPVSEGLLIKGRPSPDEIMDRQNSHIEKIKAMRIREAKNRRPEKDLRRIFRRTELEPKKMKFA